LYSAEIDERLALRAKKFFKGFPNVEIRQGDCFEVLKDQMPFDLLFSDVQNRWD